MATYNDVIRVVAGMLDPRTRADEVRIIRHKMGLPVGMEMRPDLERRRRVQMRRRRELTPEDIRDL